VIDELRQVDPDEALTIAECAALAKRHPQTIRREIRRGALAAFRERNGAHPRVRRRDFVAWLYAEPVDVEAEVEPPVSPAARSRRRTPRRGSVEALRAIEEERRSASR
jgi:hypothetical protein